MYKYFDIHRKNVFLLLVLWLVLYLFYYNVLTQLLQPYISSLIWKSHRKVLSYNVTNGNVSDIYLIETPGCTIPNFSRDFHYIEAKDYKNKCGNRAVFIENTARDIITFFIVEQNFEKNLLGKEGYKCCYQFAARSTVPNNEDIAITYTSCKPFQNGTKVSFDNEVIIVTCHPQPSTKKEAIYKDAFILLKKQTNDENSAKAGEISWNVLLLGMDTMSRARAFHSMPRMVKYFETNHWLDFRAFQKVGFNTFPNVVTTLTGKKLSTVYSACRKGMYYCNDLMIWSKYKEYGYVTAYGEDYLTLPDTFARYKGFKIPPTDHYTRPFFLTGEHVNGNIVCAKIKPSALHLLDYAYQFTNAYKYEKFFGVFWINSYSHNTNNIPTLLQDHLIDFFEKLDNDGVLNNTLIIFFSDHGIRYGPMRIPVESFYEERLPMLFMWIPSSFRKQHISEYYNMQLNQFRLATHYDLHSTLWDILKLSNNNVSTVPPEACPQCSSLFVEKSINRSCADANVDAKWCSCHVLNKVPDNDDMANVVPAIAISYLNNFTNTIKTKKCKICSPLKIKTVLRNHSYRDDYNNKTYYVVAFKVTSQNVMFELSLEAYNNEYKVLEGTHTISGYSKRDSCVINPNDHEFCICGKDKRCIKKTKFSFDFYLINLNRFFSQ